MPSSAAYVAVLGPVRLWWDGQERPVKSAAARALLGWSVLVRERTPSAAEDLRHVWPTLSPDTARRRARDALQLLRDACPGASWPSWPDLAEQCDSDLRQWSTLIAGARDAAASDPDFSAQHMRGAMLLWREPVLPLLAESPDLEQLVRELEQERLAGEELLHDLLLATGALQEAVPRLRHAVARNPQHEVAIVQLATALYLSSRQAEALIVLQDHAEELAGEHLRPGPEIDAVRAAILRDRPELLPRPARLSR